MNALRLDLQLPHYPGLGRLVRPQALQRKVENIGFELASLTRNVGSSGYTRIAPSARGSCHQYCR
jgi:hypothetical protein